MTYSPGIRPSERNILMNIANTLEAQSTAPGAKSAPAAVSVTTTATPLLAAGAATKRVEIFNNSTDTTLYIGKSAAVTAANGLPVFPLSGYDDDGTTDAWYGIVASGTADVRVLGVS